MCLLASLHALGARFLCSGTDIVSKPVHWCMLRVVIPASAARARFESATVDEGDVSCQVSDFGLSMLMKPGQDQAQAMQHGTLAYMPPELITDDALSFATDVYSFGILLWEMFTAKVLPADGCCPAGLLEVIANLTLPLAVSEPGHPCPCEASIAAEACSPRYLSCPNAAKAR